jgi:hypothetical protein
MRMVWLWWERESRLRGWRASESESEMRGHGANTQTKTLTVSWSACPTSKTYLSTVYMVPSPVTPTDSASRNTCSPRPEANSDIPAGPPLASSHTSTTQSTGHSHLHASPAPQPCYSRALHGSSRSSRSLASACGRTTSPIEDCNV